MKGGHLDKSCELCWAQGNFLANLGPPELLKYFSEASESCVIPDRVQGGSVTPSRTGAAVLGAEGPGAQHVEPGCSLPALSALPALGSSPLSLVGARRRLAGLDAAREGLGRVGPVCWRNQDLWVTVLQGSLAPVNSSDGRDLSCPLGQESGNFCKRPDSKYPRFCRPCSFCHNCYS